MKINSIRKSEGRMCQMWSGSHAVALVEHWLFVWLHKPLTSTQRRITACCGFVKFMICSQAPRMLLLTGYYFKTQWEGGGEQ